jgi:hypothetical protein
MKSGSLPGPLGGWADAGGGAKKPTARRGIRLTKRAFDMVVPGRERLG